MKILIVDDEHSFGALLGHTLKRLGHKPVITVNPADALELLSSDVDAVITDIDMPVMNGIELAEQIRARNAGIPIAFCTGSAPEGRMMELASRIGRVLPKVWTVADVKAVVDELRARQRRQPGRKPESLAHLYAEPATDQATTDDDDAAAARAETSRVERRTAGRPPRVKVMFRRWSQLKRLCDDSRRGPVYATVPGHRELSPGQEVSISLALPDEISVKIAGEVQAVRPAQHGKAAEVIIELAGLTDAMANRLRSLALASDASLAEPSGAFCPDSETSYLEVARRRAPSGTPTRELARGSDRDLEVSALLLRNQRLRDQIEELPRRLKGDDED